MPSVLDYKPPKRKFVKKPYRPWDILGIGEISSDTDSKLEQTKAKLEQTKAKLEQTKAKLEQTSSDTDSKLEQTKAKLVAIQRLCGVQKEVFWYLFSKEIDGSIIVITEELTLDIKAHIGTTRNAILRLINKGLLKRNISKEGRGGFLILSISDDVKKAVFTIKKGDVETSSKLEQTSSNLPPVSSSIYINKTTTNFTTSAREDVDNFSFPEEWEEIDIEPLAFIKFAKAHLDQIYKAGKISPDMLQASIHAFAFDLQVNGKAKTLKLSPLNVFMGMMKKGSPYLPPDNYESPEEKHMRAYLETMKKRAENLKKMESELKQLTFEEWTSTQSPEVLKALVPPRYHPESEKKIFDSLLFAHFEKEIWPTRKTSTLRG